jgi:hypothetical protein
MTDQLTTLDPANAEPVNTAPENAEPDHRTTPDGTATPDLTTAEPDIPVQDISEQDIPLPPTLGETVSSAFWRTPTASLLYQPLLAEKAFPSDTTPVDDADIEKRIREEGLVDYVDSFTHITTQGELEAQVTKIRHERKNDAIAQASGWSGFAIDLVAGAVDPLSVATFKAASFMPVVRAGMASKSFATRAGTVAAEGAGGGAVAAGALAAGNETTTIEDAPAIVAGSALLPVALYGGGSLARRFVGKAAEMLPDKKLDELGTGLKADLEKFETGAIETTVDNVADTFAGSLAKWKSAEIDLNSAEAKTIVAYTGKTNVSAEDMASAEVAKTLFGSLDTAASQKLLQLGGISRGAPALELALSDIPAARRTNALLNFAKVGLDDATNPESFYTRMEIVHGERARTISDMTSELKSWRKEKLRTPNVPVPVIGGAITDAVDSVAGKVAGKVTGQDYGQGAFHKLVYKAVIYGDDIDALPDRAEVTALKDPHVQKAAKAFRAFDHANGERLVRAGLLRRSHLTSSHIGRIYDPEQVAGRESEFVRMEADAYYRTEWEHTRKVAEKQRVEAETEAKAEFEQSQDKRLREFDAQSDKIIEDAAKLVSADAYAARTKAFEAADKAAAESFQKEEARVSARFDKEYAKKVAALEKRAVREEWSEEKLAAEIDAFTVKLNEAYADRIDALQAGVAAVKSRREERASKVFKKAVSRDTRSATNAAVKDRAAEREDLLDALDLQHKKTMGKIRAAYAKATSEDARLQVLERAGQHANGVYEAIVLGKSGDRASGRVPSGGNVRGSRVARNVYLSDRELFENGWLDTDLFRIVDNATRTDAADAVLASLFRRPMTPDEIKLHDKNADDAYWLDGDDRTTIPDLDLKTPIEEVYTQGRAAGTDPEHIRRMVAHIEDSRDIARGTFATGLDRAMGQGGRGAVALWKSFQFSYYMGRSLLTNLSDASRLIGAHGVKDVAHFGFARMRQLARDAWEGNAGISRAEMNEILKDCNIGNDEFSFARASGLLDVMDPWSAAARGNRADQLAAKLTHVGSRVFGLHMWNNLITRAAGSMALNRITRLAFHDGEFSARDAEWLKYIGLTKKDVALLRRELGTQGINLYEPYKAYNVDTDKLSEAMRSKVLSALVREVRTTVVTPNPANLPNFMRNPVIGTLMQFKSYSLEATQSVHLRRSQIAAAGDYSLAAQGLTSLLLAAYGSFVVKAMSDSLSGDPAKQKNFEKALRAHETDPGATLYQVLDYGSISPLLFTYNNLFEDVTGFGIKRGFQALAGDKHGLGPLSSSRSAARGSPAALLGPGGRTLDVASSVGQDVLGIGKRHVSRRTLDNAARLVPYSGTFYLQRAVNSSKDALAAGMRLPKR